MRAKAWSAGISGVLVTVTFGWLAVLPMVSEAFIVWVWLLTIKLRLGSVRLPPLKPTSPVSKVRVCPAMSRLPRTR